MSVMVASVAQRPDLAGLLDAFPDAWPEFMNHHPLSALFYDLATTEYADFCLVAVDPAAPDRPVARAYSIPFHWGADPGQDLPPGGHDAVILQAARDRTAGRRGNLVAAIEIAVAPARRGTGVSHVMLDALRDNAARLGYRSLVAPVRPNRKHEHLDVTMTRYARWARPDGLPVDPWLRVHVRAGGRIGAVAPCSMTLSATLDEWRAWTGLPFDTTGPVQVPEALAPVHCDVAADHAVYVEPNIWVHHPLATPLIKDSGT